MNNNSSQSNFIFIIEYDKKMNMLNYKYQAKPTGQQKLIITFYSTNRKILLIQVLLMIILKIIIMII